MANCKNCGYELPETVGLLCPNCGFTLIPEKKPGRRKPLRLTLPSLPRFEKRERQTSPRPARQESAPRAKRETPRPTKPETPRPTKQETPHPTQQERPRLNLRFTPNLWKRLLVILLALVFFIGVMAGAAYAGLYLGERDRQTARLTVVQEHYTAGLEALNEGRFERAVAEFQYVLQLDPQHALAEQGLTEARARLAFKPTPTLEAAVSLAEQLLDQARATFDANDWVATARTLTQLRALDPDYERDAIEEMLFTSLYNAGTAFLEEEALEVGISYLDQAIALRPLDANAVNQRNLAARYLDALNYWGVDWKLAIERFEALYATNPGYRDVAQRVYRAYLAYADYFAAQGEMCPAEMQYAQALRLYVDPTIDQKRADASQVCLIATPTPLDGMSPQLTPQPIPGFTYGRLAYPVYNSTTGGYDLYALYADGRILRAASGADQPWWELGTGRMAYRDRAAGGVKMVLPEEGIPLQLLPALGQAWPTLSPDSRRVAYATSTGGVWSIYIANTDGTGEPRLLANGWAPAWGASGLLAYTGCDASGLCGIILDNPDDDQPGTRLTGSQNDSAVSWAPGGNMLAYMTNVTGNWDIILLSPDGGVEQLTFDASDEGLPVWSPDGGWLGFVSNRDGNWAIYVMQINGQNVQRILDLGPSLPGWENQRLSWVP